MILKHMTILVTVAALLAPVASSAQPVPAPAPHPLPDAAGPRGLELGLSLVAGALAHKH
ncbi:hypothetical protein [Antarcticimicrobium sediminis]|uniref:hypothetical protein n=1 Tax=Antarcticimicrobium sediminis TaxID=2546227 RepID=UPI00140462BA|nr:hypothetical protein [Antarcticimicrobium sediminis]